MKNQNLFRIILAASFAISFGTMGSQAYADDTAQLKDQVQALQNRVDQLESQLANRQQSAASTPTPVSDQWGTDPFTQMILMREQMDRNMRQALADTGAFSPRMDMKQTDKHYIITMDIPGMDKNKINVEAKDGILTISGERRSEADNNGNQYYRQERSFGTFLQAIPLPEDAQKDHIEAKYKNGVLTVIVARVKHDVNKSEGDKIMVQ
jgi:HSP20 family protein